MKRMIAVGNEKGNFDVPIAFFHSMFVNAKKLTGDVQKESNVRELRLFFDILMCGLRAEEQGIWKPAFKMLVELQNEVPKLFIDSLRQNGQTANGGALSSTQACFGDIFMQVSSKDINRISGQIRR